MIFVNRSSIEIPSIFGSKEVRIANESLESFYRSASLNPQRKFTIPFETEIRSAIMPSLLQLFSSKCAYCETLLKESSGVGLDNFRPRYGARGMDNEFAERHYWWLSYEWRNLYPACIACGRHKATWFPVNGQRAIVNSQYDEIVSSEDSLLIDPCVEKPEEHLLFNDRGEVEFLTSKGKATIELLNLNRPNLILERKAAIEETLTSIRTFSDMIGDREASLDMYQTLINKFESIVASTSTLSHVAARRDALLRVLSDDSSFSNYYKSIIAKRIAPLTAVPISEVKPLTREQKQVIDLQEEINSLSRVYLDTIELMNFKCFSHLRIDFNPATPFVNKVVNDNIGQPWVMFLGENAVGKSSLLKAIAIALMGRSYIEELGELLEPAELLKEGEEEGFIKLSLTDGRTSIVQFKQNDSFISTTLANPITNLLAYGAIRLRPRNSLQPEIGKFVGTKVKNLFDYTVSLVNADTWLLELDNETFNKAALAIKELMLLPDDALLIQERLAAKSSIKIAYADGRTIGIEKLSDGYQSLYALAVDIMASLSNEKSTYELAEGIILIDELGTHLHPRWKMQVVTALRRAFKRLQFIVSTHEPLCLRGIREGETTVLTRSNEGEPIAIQDLPDPSALRIDQILTSDFFGLRSVIDPETEKIFDEYYSILAIDELDRSDSQKNRLIELSDAIPKLKHLGNDAREELIYYVIDELLAKKGKDQGLKITNELKQKAIERVASIWKLVSSYN